jgi:hypothetical protein
MFLEGENRKESVREVGEIPIIMDIKGPEIRIRAKKRRVHEGEVLDAGFNGQEITFILHGRQVTNRDALVNPESLDFYEKIASKLQGNRSGTLLWE